MERHFPSQDEMFPDIHKIVILKCTFKLCILHSLSLIADKWKEISMFSYNQQINYSMSNCSLLLISSISTSNHIYLLLQAIYEKVFAVGRYSLYLRDLVFKLYLLVLYYCITQDIFQIQSKVQPNPAIQY